MLAASKGSAPAMTNLGVLYALGKGVPLNYIEAYKWANLGGGNGNKKGAKLRDLVEKQLTISQIEKAQELGRKCLKTKYKQC